MSGTNDHGWGPKGQLKFENSVLILEVVRGRTRFPLRPVTSDEYLIGSSPVCDLQLTPESPEFHSFITFDEEGSEVTVTQSTSPLFVNGVAVERCRIQPGDRIELGSIELLVHAGEAAEAIGIESSGEEELTIDQLLDAIELDLSIISELEDSQDLAEVDSLLAAAHEVAVRESTGNVRRWPGSSPFERVCVRLSTTETDAPSPESDRSAA